MLPALVGQLVVILKDSALGTAIIYPELLQAAKDIGTAYATRSRPTSSSAVIFILINFGLTVARRPRRAPAQPPRPRSAQGAVATGVVGRRHGGHPDRRHRRRRRLHRRRGDRDRLKPDRAGTRRRPRHQWCQGLRRGGSPDWTRTNNLPVNSRLLCQLSYRGMLLGDTIAKALATTANGWRSRS